MPDTKDYILTPRTAPPSGKYAHWLKLLRWPLIFAGAAYVSFCSWSWQRHGLFNNTGDLNTALVEHKEAWKLQGLGRQVQRLKLSLLIDDNSGSCITEDSDWSNVNLVESTDYLATTGKLVACHVSIKGRWPAQFPRSYIWTLILRPHLGDVLEVQNVSRQTFVD